MSASNTLEAEDLTEAREIADRAQLRRLRALVPKLKELLAETEEESGQRLRDLAEVTAERNILAARADAQAAELANLRTQLATHRGELIR